MRLPAGTPRSRNQSFVGAAMSSELRVEVPDGERGFVLAGTLARYGARVVSNQDERYEVRVAQPDEHDLADALALIERWVHDEHVGRAQVAINGRSYTMAA